MNNCSAPLSSQFDTAESTRISEIRKRYRTEVPYISVQRARYYTESWRETHGKGIPRGLRVALAMKNVFSKMDICVDPLDRIAGAWTENYVGIPIDIERGLFNRVLEIELNRVTLATHHLKSGLRYAKYALSNYSIGDFAATVSAASKMDIGFPSSAMDTIDRRKLNPYRIRKTDRQMFLGDLLPYWEGRTVADIVKDEVSRAGLYSESFRGFVDSLPTTARDATIVSPGSAIGTWQGHLVLDHETVLQKGLLSMKDDISGRISESKYGGKHELDFLRSVETALEGIIIFAERLAAGIKKAADLAGDVRTRNILNRMYEDCCVVPLHPAGSFRQALQSYWTVKNAVELSMPFNVHAPGRLDQMLIPYYRNDIENGRITGEEAVELLEELFLKIMSHNMRPVSSLTIEFSQRYEGSEPVTLGGLTREENDAVNELTWLMIDAAEQSKASLNFVVRFHPDSSDELYQRVAEAYFRGTSSISIMNDETGIQALKKYGFSSEDANDYAITGCVDMVAPGKTGGEGFSSLLLCRTLDMVLRNGDTRTVAGIVRDTGLKTGKVESFHTFDQFLDAFFMQADNEIERIVKAAVIRDSVFARVLPSPFISAFMGGCLDKNRDVTAGGAMYDLEGILIMGSIANLTDSLYVIKKLVFEQKLFTLKQLVSAIDSNFKDDSDLHCAIMSLPGKWGNGNPESDAIARLVTDHLFSEIKKHRTFKGGRFAPFINSMTAHTIDGRMSLATPDGRKGGMPFAASCNPYNVECNGTTGVLRSVSAIDFTDVLGCAVNIRLHPSAIGSSESSRNKWISLVKTYFRLGGEQLQPTVVSTALLLEAQKHPEQYSDIIVKVGGYSAYFTELGHEIQNEIISRSEHNR
ncbi:MAG TPA: pyruvate formate lyase family protein [bacterium]|nr:pyruvate formate lyase family protein [bacterium]